jgi:hypothetical protein
MRFKSNDPPFGQGGLGYKPRYNQRFITGGGKGKINVIDDISSSTPTTITKPLVKTKRNEGVTFTSDDIDELDALDALIPEGQRELLAKNQAKFEAKRKEIEENQKKAREQIRLQSIETEKRIKAQIKENEKKAKLEKIAKEKEAKELREFIEKRKQEKEKALALIDKKTKEAKELTDTDLGIRKRNLEEKAELTNIEKIALSRLSLEEKRRKVNQMGFEDTSMNVQGISGTDFEPIGVELLKKIDPVRYKGLTLVENLTSKIKNSAISKIKIHDDTVKFDDEKIVKNLSQDAVGANGSLDFKNYATKAFTVDVDQGIKIERRWDKKTMKYSEPIITPLDGIPTTSSKVTGHDYGSNILYKELPDGKIVELGQYKLGYGLVKKAIGFNEIILKTSDNKIYKHDVLKHVGTTTASMYHPVDVDLIKFPLLDTSVIGDGEKLVELRVNEAYRERRPTRDMFPKGNKDDYSDITNDELFNDALVNYNEREQLRNKEHLIPWDFLEKIE